MWGLQLPEDREEGEIKERLNRTSEPESTEGPTGNFHSKRDPRSSIGHRAFVRAFPLPASSANIFCKRSAMNPRCHVARKR